MKILLVYDVDGWCWHHLSRALQKYADPRYEVRIRSLTSVTCDDYLWADGALHWHWSWCQHEACYQAFLQGKRPRLATVLHHDAILYDPDDYPSDLRAVATTAGRCRSTALQLLPKHDIVIAANRRLHQFALDNGLNAIFLPAPVDHELFFTARKRKKEDTPTIAWCGQVTEDAFKPDQKGHFLILQDLKKKVGRKFRWKINTSNYRDCSSPEEMAIWYATADIFLCTSLVEGTPMPVMEAMSSGLPIVSTNVGVIPDLETAGVQYLPDEIRKEADCFVAQMELADLLIDLSGNFHRREEMGQANRNAVEQIYSAKALSEKWFRTILNQ